MTVLQENFEKILPDFLLFRQSGKYLMRSARKSLKKIFDYFSLFKASCHYIDVYTLFLYIRIKTRLS